MKRKSEDEICGEALADFVGGLVAGRWRTTREFLSQRPEVPARLEDLLEAALFLQSWRFPKKRRNGPENRRHRAQ